MNNRIVLILAGLLTVAVFASLAHYGWTHRYGSPEVYENRAPLALAVPFHPTPLKLGADDLLDGAWQDLPSLEVPLMPQMSQKPWPTGSVPAVRVQAFHDGNDIYFRLVWEDDIADRTLSVESFSDACAVAVPLDSTGPVQSIMMGFSSPVNIWHWQACKDAQVWQDGPPVRGVEPDFTYPFESQETLPVSKPTLGTAVTDLLAQRAGSLTRKDRQIVQGRARWDEGVWSVVLKRSLKTDDAEQDCQFEGGPCSASFAVWDGDQGHRGARKSISEWVILNIQPASRESSARPGKLVERGAQNALVARASGGFHLPLLASVGTVGAMAQTPSPTPREPEPRLINVVAERFSYTPSRITVHKGQRVTLRLESMDVTHGLYLDGYGINIKARPGMVGKATFTANKSGRFTFRCSETCGEFHPYMVGFLEVTPNKRFNVFAAATGVTFLAILVIVMLRGKQQRRLNDDVGTE